MASQITSLMIVYSSFYSGTDQRRHQSPASLAFVPGIHRWPVNSPHKGPVTRKMFPFDDVIMQSSKLHCPYPLHKKIEALVWASLSKVFATLDYFNAILLLWTGNESGNVCNQVRTSPFPEKCWGLQNSWWRFPCHWAFFRGIFRWIPLTKGW